MTNQQEVKNEIKKLIINSITPLEWEIKELGKYEEPKTRLKAFEARGLTIEINNLPSKAERELITTELAKALGRTLEAAEDLLDKTDDLMNTLGGAFHGGDFKKSGEGIRIAEIIYDWFLKNNGKFYVTEDDRPWLFYHGKHYEIKTANDSFNALMFNLTKLAHIEKPGNLVWYALCQLCLNKGDKIATSTWCFTDREADTIYLNLSLPHHKILKISPGEDPKLLDNGTNEHSVLLKESHNIKTFKYMPDAVEAEGFSAIKKYLMDCAPCELPQRYFIVCWFISNFMIDYFSDRGIVQIIGSSGLGKSKIPERMSTLLFGQNLVGQGTGSADVRIASQDPLNFQDNLENKDLTQSKINFFLLLANAATKNKAKAGSDTAVVGQKLNSLCVVTSIEPFPGKWPELINRTFSIILEGKYSLTNYVHDEYVRNITKQRDLILSTVFKLIGKKVLPKLNERTSWSAFINSKFPKHNKARMNEHLCMMSIILEAVLEYLPYKPELEVKQQASQLIEAWINYQEIQAEQTSKTSNVLLTIMDGIFREIWFKIKAVDDPQWFTHKDLGNVCEYFHEDYQMSFYYTKQEHNKVTDDPDNLTEDVQHLTVMGSAAELHTLFNRYLKNQHQKNPFDNPVTLGARLRNDKHLLEQAGWAYLTKRGSDNIFFKTIKGKNIWALSREIRSYFSI